MKYYHYYTHKSGMKVLLIQNEFSLFNGVSMSIDGGVNKEPPNIYGLAHFTEHMMFLGSKKHPKPSTFVDYVTTNGGRFNGFTEFEKTAFFCEIKSISGHFLFIKGVTLEKKTFMGFVKAFVVAFTKSKNEDIGNALEKGFEGIDNKT